MKRLKLNTKEIDPIKTLVKFDKNQIICEISARLW